ncbi:MULTISPECIES: hypothetical protein [Chitinophagaceae]
MVAATSIVFFDDLAQHEYEGVFYDFHNDYSCEKITYIEGVLSLFLKNVVSRISLSLRFLGATVIKMDLFNIKYVNGLTLDSLYRGRFEFNGSLIEESQKGEGYFYLEFYEGQRIEFWAISLEIVNG